MNKEDLDTAAPNRLNGVQDRRLTSLIAQIRKITHSIHPLAFLGLGCVWWVIGSIGMFAYFPERGIDSWMWNNIGISALCLAFIPGLIRRIKLGRRMQELLTFHDKRMIGVLIETLPYSSHRWSYRAKMVLIELLLSMEATDRGFNDDQRLQLHKILKGEDAPLIVAALHALKQVGTIVSLRHVNVLAAGGGAAIHSESVRIAAITCQTELRKQMLDRKNLGLLIDFMQAREEYPRFWIEVREALIQMLPQITIADIQRIHAENRKALYCYLLERDILLIVPILQVCERLGLVEALPYLESLLSGKLSYLFPPEVVVRAASCQRTLQQLLERHNSSQVLLRATTAPGTPDRELVRPATEKDAGDPEELLRATITTRKS